MSLMCVCGGTSPSETSLPGTATYYVDSVSGSESNPGTSPSTSWKTLTKVNVVTYRPGDRILFKSGGVWSGQLWPKGSGTEAHPIIIDKYGGDVKPVINGAGLAEDAFLLKNQEYWEVQNLEVTNTGSGKAVRRAVHVAVENYGDAHHIYLRSLTIHDVNGDNGVKANGGINYTCEGDSKPSRFVDLRIEGNRIYHVDRSGIFGGSTHWVRSKWYPSLGVMVRNNVLDDIGADGIVVVAADGALIEHNVVSHANQRSDDYNVAIWSWSADNTVIQYNEAYGTKGQRDGEGFDSDWNSRNTLIQYNYSHDNEGGFLLICNSGKVGQDNIGNIGTVVRYNISQNDLNRGITVTGPVKDTLIYNNTIYVGPGINTNIVLYADWDGWSASTHLYNNIFFSAGTAQFSYGVSRASDGAYVTAPGWGKSSDNVFDSNVYFGNIVPANDANLLTADPQLVAPGTGATGRQSLAGYHLGPGSPARKSGKRIANHGGRDFWGNAVAACSGTDRGAAQDSACVAARN